MFCHKCGSQSIEGSAFCQKCGAKLITDNTSQQTATSVTVNPMQPQARDTQADKPKKKKSKKLPIILGVVVLVIVVIIIAASLGDKTDYVMTVKAHSPFVSQGYSYTYGTVLNDYIDSPIWEVSKANDKTYVNTRGKTKDTGDNILVSILVAVGANDQAVITPASVAIGRDRIEGQDNVVRFLLDLFMAYDGGQSGTSQKSGDTSYTTYTSEEHGFSFQYPSDWIDGGAQTVTEIIRVYDGYGASLSVSEVYVLPFELGTGDEALIEAAINDNGIVPYKFVSVDDIGVNGKVMRELVYTNEDAVHGLLYVSNYFYFVEDRDYQIKIELPADTFDNYQTVYETMMNSYTITDTSGGSALPPSNHDEAYNIAQTWLDAHPAMGATISGGDNDLYHADGEEYYLFYLSEMYYANLLVNSKTGELSIMINHDGEEPYSEIEPVDDYYNRFYGTSDAGITSREILYKGYSVNEFLGAHKDTVIGYLGAPTEDLANYYYLTYDDISFGYDANGSIYYINLEPKACEVNGAKLDTSRTGLINLLGDPIYEDWDEYGEEYQRNFINSNTFVSFAFLSDDVNEQARWIRISPAADGSGDDYSDEYNASDNYIDGNFEWVEQPTRSVANNIGGGWNQGYYIEPTNIGQKIEGRVKNISGKSYSYVQIMYTLFDSSGNQIGTAVDAINNLGAGSTWKFSAEYSDDRATRFEFAGISGL